MGYIVILDPVIKDKQKGGPSNVNKLYQNANIFYKKFPEKLSKAK